MKKFVISICALLVLVGLIVFHTVVMQKFGKGSADISEKIENFATKNEWKSAEEGLKDLEELWNKRRFWVSLTMRTNVIEEIDISLEQSKAYANLKQKPDFFGEFIMLKNLMEHIPHQEGLHIEEVL